MALMKGIFQTIAPFPSHRALKEAEDGGSGDAALASAAPLVNWPFLAHTGVSRD